MWARYGWFWALERAESITAGRSQLAATATADGLLLERLVITLSPGESSDLSLLYRQTARLARASRAMTSSRETIVEVLSAPQSEGLAGIQRVRPIEMVLNTSWAERFHGPTELTNRPARTWLSSMGSSRNLPDADLLILNPPVTRRSGGSARAPKGGVA